MFTAIKNVAWVLVVALVITCPLMAQPEQIQPNPDPAPNPDFGFLLIDFADSAGTPGVLAILKPGTETTMSIAFGSQGSLGRGKLTFVFAEIDDTADGPTVLTPGVWFHEMVSAEADYVQQILVPQYLQGRSFAVQAACAYDNGFVEYSPIMTVMIASDGSSEEPDDALPQDFAEDQVPADPAKHFLILVDKAPVTEL